MISFYAFHDFARNHARALCLHCARGIPLGVGVHAVVVHSETSSYFLVHAQLSCPVLHDPAKLHGRSGNNQFLLLAYST